MHNGIANRQRTSRKLNVMQRKTLAIDRAEFIVTDLEKHTSYEDEIKTSVELKESCNLDADFKLGINISTGTDQKSQLRISQLPVYFTASALVISFKTTAELGKA